MRFTDVFIKKPVLATVVSLFILLLGLRAGFDLNVRQFPEIQNAVVTISTSYIGADADLMQGFITSPMERAVASAEGIDYIVSNSSAGMSMIQAYLRLDYDPNEALTQIAAKVNALRSDLPENAMDPVVNLAIGQQVAAMYLSFYSDVLDSNQITDYVTRVVEPQLSTIPGVQQAQILGARTFAMRIWLDPERMAAQGLTGSDVMRALQSNNVLAALGRTKGQMVAIDLTAATDLRTVEEFEQLVVRSESDAVVRLRDVAEVELGAENYNASVSFNGQSATFMGIEVSPDANALDVIAEVRRVWEESIITQLPEGLNGDIPYDSTEYIQSSIDEVIITIVLALIIVVLVIYAFLGSIRSVIIPAVAAPLSLIGTLFIIWIMGFSINLLTLLAMVLAIGIVVDDAIIMLENIQRHIEEGMSRKKAAIQGARELAWPVVAMSTTLIAVFIPLGFMGGLTGVLFLEFAFTLAATTVVSGIVALTLSPMMCAYILVSRKNAGTRPKLEMKLDEFFEKLRAGFQRKLHGALNALPVVLVFGGAILISCYFLFVTSPTELEPQEDVGFIFTIAEGDSYGTLDNTNLSARHLSNLIAEVDEVDKMFVIGGFNGTNSVGAGVVLKTWDDRSRSTKEVLDESVQPFLEKIPGLNAFAIIPPSLPTPGGGPPVQFVIGSTQPFEAIGEVAQDIVGRAMASGRFIFMDTDLKIDRPRQTVHIDREKAALMGVDMQQIASDVGSMMAGAYAGRF
ncbi:MAG TPA: efflux RND transporter permease subunit, partial [Cellvibrionaceae bacterium]